jgi:hypothetical protein
MAGQTACPEEALARARKHCQGRKREADGNGNGGGRISDLKFEISDLGDAVGELRVEICNLGFQIRRAPGQAGEFKSRRKIFGGRETIRNEGGDDELHG